MSMTKYFGYWVDNILSD